MYGKNYDNINNKTLPLSVAIILRVQLSRFNFLKNEIYGNGALFFLCVVKLILSCKKS